MAINIISYKSINKLTIKTRFNNISTIKPYLGVMPFAKEGQEVPQISKYAIIMGTWNALKEQKTKDAKGKGKGKKKGKNKK